VPVIPVERPEERAIDLPTGHAPEVDSPPTNPSAATSPPSHSPAEDERDFPLWECGVPEIALSNSGWNGPPNVELWDVTLTAGLYRDCVERIRMEQVAERWELWHVTLTGAEKSVLPQNRDETIAICKYLGSDDRCFNGLASVSVELVTPPSLSHGWTASALYYAGII
jgi:hypothetical protein